jgi:RNA polymerase sigma factor (sigma-70 family)
VGDERREFEKIFLPHLDAAYNLARWILQNDHDAQDVVQEAYVRAFKGFSGFRGENGRAWLLTIVRNAAYTWLNKRLPEQKVVPYIEEKHAEIVWIDQSANESVLEKRKEELRRALERLPSEFREVIILYELEGLSYKELALSLGIPVGTVMSRLSRARRRLQQEFAQFYGRSAANEL